MSFDPSQHPRDASGQFAEKTGSAPEVALDENLTYYRREVAESFGRGITALRDMVDTAPTPSARLIGKLNGLIKVWDRQGDRIQNAKSLRDLAAIIGFIRLESPSEQDAREGEKEGEELAVSYLRSFAKNFPDEA